MKYQKLYCEKYLKIVPDSHVLKTATLVLLSLHYLKNSYDDKRFLLDKLNQESVPKFPQFCFRQNSMLAEWVEMLQG